MSLAVSPSRHLVDRPLASTSTRAFRTTPDSATLRRAVSYIETHAADDICAEDIARAASVTVRSVQLAFQRHLRTTPGAYLRQVRLEHAHRELRQATRRRGETVAEIAARWRFSSPSRFAAYYRQRFGVMPSRTLDL